MKPGPRRTSPGPRGRFPAWVLVVPWLAVACGDSSGTPGILGTGLFVADCENQAPWICTGAVTEVAVGAAIRVSFEPADTSTPDTDVVAVGARWPSRAMIGALVGLTEEDRLIDWINVEAVDIADVGLELTWYSDTDLYPTEHTGFAEVVHVGIDGSGQDPESLYLVPRSAVDEALLGLLAWQVAVEPAVATVEVRGNHLWLHPIPGTPDTVSATLRVALPGRQQTWTFPLSVRIPDPDAFPDDVLEDATADVQDAAGPVDAAVGEDLASQEIPASTDANAADVTDPADGQDGGDTGTPDATADGTQEAP